MGFLYSQFVASQFLPYPTESYAGKTVIVTGSNVGLGKEAARHFTRLGASTVILAVRSLEKGNAAKADIDKTTGCASGVVQVWHLDMGNFASVKSFAARASKELERIDNFVANAGIAAPKFTLVEGYESMITVNVVSTFLLAFLVLPKMKETAKRFGTRPTLTITTSDVHGWTKFTEQKAPEGKIFDTLNDEAKFKDDRYPTSKLLEVLAVRAFADRWPAKSFPVTINMVTPGFCHSELARDAGWPLYLLKLVCARTTEKGSRTLVTAASQGAESHGQYMADCKIEPPSAWVRSEEGKIGQDRVWKELVGRLETISPGIMRNV